MRVVVLTSDTPANVWLVNQLMARHDVAGMVIERPPLAQTPEEKSERRRRMVQRHGLARTLNKLAYNWFRSRFLSDSWAATAKEQFFPGGAPVAYLREIPMVIVGNINDFQCVEFIKSLAPEVLAVCGTTVIRHEVFSMAPIGAINMHTGITPEYRSADPIFWALYRGEPHKIGVTIHFIDRGIDTGPIILQEPVPVYAEDSLASIYLRCIYRGAELYSRALSQIEDGTISTVSRIGAASHAFRSIDLGIVQYLRFRIRFRRMAERLPRSKTAVTSAVRDVRP